MKLSEITQKEAHKYYYLGEGFFGPRCRDNQSKTRNCNKKTKWIFSSMLHLTV